MTVQPAPRRVVLAPDVLLGAFSNAEARAWLNDWRDGRIQLVVNRDLLLIYLRLLREAGVPESLLRDWAAWFTHPDKVMFLAESGIAEDPAPRLFAEIGRALAEAARCEIVSGTVTGIRLQAEDCPRDAAETKGES